MHASDIAYQTDAAGRTFYELETGSSVSYDSPIRYITIDRYALDGGAIGEKFTSSVHALQSLAGFASSGITNPAPWNDAAFKAAYEEYTSKENPTEEDWDKVVATNPEYLAYMLHYDAMNSMSYNEYITDVIIAVIVYLSAFSLLIKTLLGHHRAHKTEAPLKDAGSDDSDSKAEGKEAAKA